MTRFCPEADIQFPGGEETSLGGIDCPDCGACDSFDRAFLQTERASIGESLEVEPYMALEVLSEQAVLAAFCRREFDPQGDRYFEELFPEQIRHRLGGTLFYPMRAVLASLEHLHRQGHEWVATPQIISMITTDSKHGGGFRESTRLLHESGHADRIAGKSHQPAQTRLYRSKQLRNVFEEDEKLSLLLHLLEDRDIGQPAETSIISAAEYAAIVGTLPKPLWDSPLRWRRS